jgi:hypothetical protein
MPNLHEYKFVFNFETPKALKRFATSPAAKVAEDGSLYIGMDVYRLLFATHWLKPYTNMPNSLVILGSLPRSMRCINMAPVVKYFADKAGSKMANLLIYSKDAQTTDDYSRYYLRLQYDKDCIQYKVSALHANFIIGMHYGLDNTTEYHDDQYDVLTDKAFNDASVATIEYRDLNQSKAVCC